MLVASCLTGVDGCSAGRGDTPLVSFRVLHLLLKQLCLQWMVMEVDDCSTSLKPMATGGINGE